jgi:hypothetical protein
MLRRQRQIRVQVMKFVDAGLFCFGFWLAHFIRSKFLRVEIFGGTADIQPFSEYLWLLLVVFMSTPLLLEMQGFYSRPLIPSRRRTAWQLLKACGLSLVTVIFALFLFKQLQLARAVPFIFGATAFGLMFLKEELVRQWLKTTLGQSQLRRRFILAGTREDTMRLRDELKQTSDDLEIVAQLDLNQTSVEHLVDLLHKHSANGVILSAQHMFFGQIEKAIQACELEGVEAWLMADFANFARRSLWPSHACVSIHAGRVVAEFGQANDGCGGGVLRPGSSRHSVAHHRRAHQADLAGTGIVPATTQRIERTPVHDAQIPLDGDECGAVETGTRSVE